jgi:protein subunit release factor A
MKKIILATAITLFSINQINAKTTKTTRYQTHSNDEKVAKMTSVVGLSAEQQKKYKALLESSAKSKEALDTKLKTATKEEKKKLQTEYKNNYEAELKKILTPAQMTKLKEEAAKNKK